MGPGTTCLLIAFHSLHSNTISSDAVIERSGTAAPGRSRVNILVQPRSSRRLCCTAAKDADEASESSLLSDSLEHCQLLFCQTALEVVAHAPRSQICVDCPRCPVPVMRMSTTNCAPVNQETLLSLLRTTNANGRTVAQTATTMKSAKIHPPRLVVLVTGAASGIGRATSLALASAGDAEALKFKVQLTAAAWVQPTYCPPIKSLAGQFIASEPRDLLCSAVDTGTCALALSCIQHLNMKMQLTTYVPICGRRISAAALRSASNILSIL